MSVLNTATRTVATTIPVGSGPRGIAISPDGSSAYVPSQDSNSIYVIDTATNTIRGTVFPVGIQRPQAPVTEPRAVTVSPDGRFVYVTNEGSYSVSVIDAATNTVATVIGVTGLPAGIAAVPPPLGPPPTAPATRTATASFTPSPTPTGSPPTPRLMPSAGLRTLAYVANENSASVSVINTATHEVVDTIPLAGYPTGIGITPDGAFAYVAAQTDSVTVINTAWDSLVTSVPLAGGSVARAVALTPDGTRALVAGNGMSVIETASNTTASTLWAGNLLSSVAITPDGKTAYVADSGGGPILVIDAASNTVSTTIPVFNAQRIAITPDGSLAYATATNLSVIDTASNTVLATFPAGATPGGIALTPDAARAYVASSNDSLFLINTVTRTIAATVYPVLSPSDLAITANGAFAYVTNWATDTVSVIRLATNTVDTLIPVGSSPVSIAIASPPLTFCVGDCREDRRMTVTNLLTGVNIVLGNRPLGDCPEFDADADGLLTVSELVAAVGNALHGCPPLPATAIPTPTPTRTPGPGECAHVCDGRFCGPVACPDGSFRDGYCELTGSNGCECVPFECPGPCGIMFDPVPPTWDQLTITLTAHGSFVGYFGIDVFIEGGAHPVSSWFSYASPFSVEVPLNPGLNQLRIRAQASEPPGCHSEFHFDVVVTSATVPLVSGGGGTRDESRDDIRAGPLA